jgi:hypothetical protein
MLLLHHTWNPDNHLKLVPDSFGLLVVHRFAGEQAWRARKHSVVSVTAAMIPPCTGGA